MIKIIARPYVGFIEVDRGRKRPFIFKRSQKTIKQDTSCAICGRIMRKGWDLCYYPAKSPNAIDDRVCVNCGDS